jgi:hypothetical protein
MRVGGSSSGESGVKTKENCEQKQNGLAKKSSPIFHKSKTGRRLYKRRMKRGS